MRIFRKLAGGLTVEVGSLEPGVQAKLEKASSLLVNMHGRGRDSYVVLAILTTCVGLILSAVYGVMNDVPTAAAGRLLGIGAVLGALLGYTLDVFWLIGHFRQRTLADYHELKELVAQSPECASFVRAYIEAFPDIIDMAARHQVKFQLA